MTATRKRKIQWRLWTLCGLALSPSQRLFADPPAGDNYRLVFADEFNGTSLDTSKWSAASPSWTMPNSNSSASASDVSVGNGVLNLTANRPTSAASFNSGSISSYGKYSFTGGYMEARIELPTTVGSWPAFWGLYSGWPPETDVMEYPLTTNGGTDGLASNQYSTNYHYTNSSGAAAAGAGTVNTGSSLAGTWHTFGVNWVPGTSMTFYLDGNVVQSYTGSSVSQMADMYMILDYAVGGWPGTPSTTQWPAGHSDTTSVDWVRIWQTNPNSDATSNWNLSGGGSFATAGNWTKGVPAYGNETAYFGRVGSASTAAVSMGAWQLFGGITFDGLTTGTLAGTTAYTLGATTNQIQLSSTTGSVTVQATAASTATQTINAGVELWSNTEVQNNMTGGQTLNLNGNLSGAGNLNVDGVGTVIVSGTGSYTGTTTIGSAAGPAVLRANADSALSTGLVTIGTAGNGTTARLELTGGRTLPNGISLSGRNTNTPGIENVSGNNTLSGTISANVGGGNYQIQSDAGTLTLGTPTGIALQASASGARTFTLQGAGNGLVSGKIQNGSGVVSLVQAGPGTWSLAAANTYTGTTTISGGTLQLMGSAAPIASYSFSPGTVSGSTVSNTGLGGSALNATFNASGGTGSIITSGGPVAGTGTLQLNGTGSLLDINSGVTNLASTSSWTVSAWVKTTQPGFTILDKGTAGSNWGNSNATFYLGVQGQTGTASGGTPVAVRYAGGWLSGTTTPAVDDGSWHLVTYTDNGSTETVYVDGVAETTTQGITNGDVGNHIRIGLGGIGEADGNAISNGSIGAVNLYNSALSAAQIQGLYTANFATLATTNILPSTSPVTLTSASSVLDLEAVNQTVASLNGPAGSGLILGYSSNLTVANTTSSEFDGSVTGNGSITESNPGTFTLGGSAITYTGSTHVGSGAVFDLANANNTGTPVARQIGAVTIAATGKITLAPAASHIDRQVLVVPSVTLAGATGAWSGSLDLANNDLIVQGAGSAGLATITNQIKQGFSGGAWQSSGGIVSSTAAGDPSHLTALGVILNNNTYGTAAGSLGAFDTINPGINDVLVKYTYYGDANLDGQVDGSDYTLIDNGFNQHGSLTGWYNGDFNYDGKIDGSDYTLIDNAFNTQAGNLSSTALIASSTAQIASADSGLSSQAVPEPATLSLLGLGVIGLLNRRRRNRS